MENSNQVLVATFISPVTPKHPLWQPTLCCIWASGPGPTHSPLRPPPTTTPRGLYPNRCRTALASDLHLPMQAKASLPQAPKVCVLPQVPLALQPSVTDTTLPPDSVLHVNGALGGQGNCRIQVHLASSTMHLQELGWVLLLQGRSRWRSPPNGAPNPATPTQPS